MSSITQENITRVFDALEAFITQRPGLDPRDYFDPADALRNRSAYWAGRRAYNAERLQISRDRARAMEALSTARRLTPARPEVLAEAFRSAFSGRLEWAGGDEGSGGGEGKLRYCTGQYFPTEYRKAAASVLEAYIAGWRRVEARENPQRFVYADMGDVVAANRAVGGHWFDQDTMRFFNCRIKSRLIAGKRFVTAERGPGDARARYTIREAKPDGSIDTVGEFQEYGSVKAAMRDILREA